MRSTFHGLETARRALYTQQTALHTTGHNIANANTPGFSRQRVNFNTTEPYPNAGFNRPSIPGQLGTGVEAGAIQRIRESFLDTQYRSENSKFGYWDARNVSLHKMEDIMNEPSEDGIAKTLDRFWTALQDLSVHPEDSGARSVVRQRAVAVAETFNYTADSLKAIQRDTKSQIEVSVNEVNSLVRQINNVNKQIASIEPHGYLPNDLYDQRDQLVDKLSQLVNIKVEQVGSGGQALEIAEGKYTIKLMDENGRDMGVTLVDGRRLETNAMQVAYDENSGLVKDIFFATERVLEDPNFNYELSGGVAKFNLDDFRAVGKLKADFESYGYIDKAGAEKGVYPEMLSSLDQMVYTFVQEFNAVHAAGWNLNEIAKGEKDTPPILFFEFNGEPLSASFKGAATSLQVSGDIMRELNNIAASAKADTVFARMTGTDHEQTGPAVRGIYTGEGTTKLTVSYSDSGWNYSLDGGTTFTEFDADQKSMTVAGLTIDISGLEPTLPDGAPADASLTWDLEVKKGYRAIGFSGDGSNALALANVKDANLKFGGSTTNIQSFYQGVIGDMAVSGNEAARMAGNADTLRMSVDQRRESVSGVSLDEEMTNLIQFQHAYNAAARTITLVDEMLDRIINGMGVAGR